MQLIPRVSLLVTLDSLGNVYIALTQSNSNSEIMGLFFQNLVSRLDQERPVWRSDTVLILDNAPYHTSTATMNHLKALDVPVLFSGPHSYSASPVELWHAAFKRDDINPGRLPLGKK